jgi:hypothetical protein
MTANLATSRPRVPTSVLSSRAFVWLRSEYLGEVERIRKKAPYRAELAPDADDTADGLFRRIVADRFMNYIPELTGGTVRWKPAGAPIAAGDPDQFEMLAHEAVKRQAKRGDRSQCDCQECTGKKPGHGFTSVDKRLAPEYRWLRALISWNGQPCLCECTDIVSHVAMIDGVTPERVQVGALEAAQGAVRFMDAAAAVPKGIRLPRTRVAYRPRADGATDDELRRLPRVYDPCHRSSHARCTDHYQLHDA